MNIYLDNSATTKISAAALKKYNDISEGFFANPSSLHSLGFLAEKELDSARAELTSALGARGASVVFTSGGTEANNLAIIGRALSKKRYIGRGKIITTDSEHASVNAPLDMLSGLGFEIAKIPTVGGKIDMTALREELSDRVILASFMLVNNETGALYDVSAAARLVRETCPDAIIHTDATQGFLKIPFTMKSLLCDMVTVSSHKIHGPKGVGALVIAEGVIKSRGISPIIFGGGQEDNLRSGTENVPAIAAFGEAVRIGKEKLSDTIKKTEALRSYLIELIEGDSELCERIKILHPPKHAPHILNISLLGIKSETLLHFLSSRGIFVSSGSACSSNKRGQPSGALIAFGIDEKVADSSVRISFSGENEPSDCEALVTVLKEAKDRLGGLRG